MSTTHSVTALEKGLRQTLVRMLKNERLSLIPLLCEVETSESDQEKHEWLGDPPQLEAIKGAREYTPLSDASVTVTNVEYDAGIMVKRTHLEDNKSGSIRRRINQLALNAVAHPNKLIIDKLINGATAGNTGYDGITFFNDTHTARGASGTFDNNLAGTGTTTAALATDLASAKARALEAKAESGEPFHGDGVGKWVVVAPPALEKAFSEVLGATQIGDTTNMQRNLAQLVISPRLSDVDDWYLLAVDPGRKPLIWQPRRPIKTDSQGPGTPAWEDEKMAKFGVSYRAGIGYAFFQSAIRTTN